MFFVERHPGLEVDRNVDVSQAISLLQKAPKDNRHPEERHLWAHLPDVFDVPPSEEETENAHTGWKGGFDVVLGNPPWERVKLQEKE